MLKPDELFSKVALNVVWQFVASESFEYDDENIAKVLHFNELSMHIGGLITGGPLGAFPWLRYFPPYRGHFQVILCSYWSIDSYTVF